MSAREVAKHGKQFSCFSLFMQHRDASMVFSYKGAFHEGLTEKIIGISENSIEGNDNPTMVNRRVSFLIVECFQNILKHGEQGDETGGEDEGIFSFRTVDDSFFINSVNLIKEKDRAQLEESFSILNGLGKDELKQLYKQQLESASLSEKGGAGLGLIQLARKSGQPIRYKFTPKSEENLLFHNQVCFNKNKEKEETDLTESVSNLYDKMISLNTLLFYKGDFSQKAILPLLSIVESNLDSAVSTPKAKRVGHVLVEMLQNITRYSQNEGKLREGIIVIRKVSEGWYLETGNIVDEEDLIGLRSKLDEIIACNDEELKALYTQRFKESIHLTDKYSTGLGLLEIARSSSHKINYRFDPYSPNQTFFSFSAIV